MNQKRELAFDILRAIAMCMVIVIHVANVYSRSFGIISNQSFLISLCFNTISRISVPLFLMISGSLLLDRPFNKTKYLKRILKYILLIIIWDVIYLIWEYLYLGITYDKLYALILQPYRAHLWFLYTIVTLYTFQPIIKIVLDKSPKFIKIILLLIWLLFSSISLISYTIATCFTIFSYMGFFILGNYIYKFVKENNLKKYNILLIVIMIISLIGSVYCNYTYSIQRNTFYNLFFAYRCPFMILASISLYILVISNYQKDTISKMVTKLSDASLGVYLIHGIFLDVTIKLFNYQSINSLIGIPIFSIMIFICSIIIVEVLKKIKYVNNIIE